MSAASRTSVQPATSATTQNDEEAVLRDLLARLPEPVGWIVEFGAWDGLYLSNSYPFVADDGWSAVLIEGDETRAAELARNWGHRDDVHTFRALVGWTPQDGLDSLLARTPIPREFDVLSVDIDGNDYYVWEAVQQYRPRLVTVEFNQTMPNEVDFVQERDPSLNQGSSIRALVRLAATKGYRLAAVEKFNAIFVVEELYDALGIEDNSIETLRADHLEEVTYLFSGYDGTVFLGGSQSLPWHGMPIFAQQVQVVPRPFRRFPGSFSRPRRLAFYAYKALVLLRHQGPRTLLRRLRRR